MEDKLYTPREIYTQVEITSDTLKRIINYLNLTSTKKYHEKAHKICDFYTEKQFNQIKQFLIDNPNKKALFMKLTKIEKYGSLENFNEMKNEKSRKTKLERYGDENYVNKEKISKSHKNNWSEHKEERIKKVKETKLERYGDENYNNSEKNKETRLHNLGIIVDDIKYYSVLDLSKIIGKSRNFIKNAISHLDLKGTSVYNIKARKEVVSYTSDCIDKIKELADLVNKDPMYMNKQTNLKKYGVEYPFQNKDVQNKCIETCKKKYGVSNYNQTKESQIRKEKTCMEKYGVKNPSQNKEVKEKVKRQSKAKLLLAKSRNLLTISDLVSIFHKDEHTLFNAIEKLNIDVVRFESDNRVYIKPSDLPILEDYFSKTEMSGTSYSEKEIVDFIKSICNFEVMENTKQIITPKELDIYIPQKKLAIEYDGLYWHDENHIENNYHLNKTIACEEKGIDLIHVFEDDWLNRKEIVKSMIASRLGIYQQRIFARNCKCKIFDYCYYKDKLQNFFNVNHLQGFAHCNIFVGLTFNDELVQCMGFNEKGWHDGNTELTRMATKLNTQVIGGFSKLMKFVTEVYGYKSISSYIYRAWFNGKGYLKSGFKVVDENPPSYSYIVDGKRIHKSQFRKDKIKRMYENKQLNYYNENKTEHELMMKNNIYRIYDCGTIKVKYTSKN